jgi:hypothetical protein
MGMARGVAVGLKFEKAHAEFSRTVFFSDENAPGHAFGHVVVEDRRFHVLVGSNLHGRLSSPSDENVDRGKRNPLRPLTISRFSVPFQGAFVGGRRIRWFAG